jgi:hypothetical protein
MIYKDILFHRRRINVLINELNTEGIKKNEIL